MSSNASSSAQMVALTQPAGKAAYDYWNALRNGRDLAGRSDVDPAALRSVLPQIMLLQHLHAKEIVFRLAGTRICQAFGRELRDHSLLSLWDRAHRSVIAGALIASLKRATPLVLRFRAHALGREPRDGECMLLPLLDEAGRAALWLGSFAFARDPLGDKTFTRLELTRAESIMPNRDRVELALAAATPRARLTLVSNRAAPAPPSARPAARATPNMTRPWAGLLEEFPKSEEA